MQAARWVNFYKSYTWYKLPVPGQLWLFTPLLVEVERLVLSVVKQINIRNTKICKLKFFNYNYILPNFLLLIKYCWCIMTLRYIITYYSIGFDLSYNANAFRYVLVHSIIKSLDAS